MTLFQALAPIASSLASGDLQFITSATGSAASAINVNNCFSAAYDHYLVMRNLSGSAGDLSLNVRLRAASTDASGANYRYQRLYADSTTVSGLRSTGETYFLEGLGVVEASAFGFAQMWISNPFAAVRTTAWVNSSYDADGSPFLYTRVQEHDLTTSYDGLSVIPGSGTITGTVYVYGLKV